MGFFHTITHAFKKVSHVILPHLGVVGGAVDGLVQGKGLKGAVQGGIQGGINAVVDIGSSYVAGQVLGPAASSGGFFSAGGIAKAGLTQVISSAASSALGIGATAQGGSYAAPTPNVQGGVTPAADPAAQAAANAAAEDEARRKKKGSAANILTSPLGISDSGQSASQLLLG